MAMRPLIFLISATAALRVVSVGYAADSIAPDFNKEVAPIFAKYCAGCHNSDDHEGNLSLESFSDLQHGGDRGAAIIPGRSDASLLVRVLTGEVEPAMPPEDNERPTAAEIDVLRNWINAGANGPDGVEPAYPELTVPEIVAAPNVPRSITSLAVAPDGARVALGKYRHVDIVDPANQSVIATTEELSGKVNSVTFSKDGSLIVAASGIAGLYGEATICRTVDGAVVTQIKGHRDAIFDARLSPDGMTLATCGYDRQIHLWNVATRELIRTLSGHNGAVFELRFSPDGATLASASADGTIKIWSTATGERLDTLGQPEGEQYTVMISPDANWIVAGGADRQVRMWRLLSHERPQINPLRFSRTAHESPVVEMASSNDGKQLATASEGRELVLWDTSALTPIHRYEQQSDVVTGIAFDPNGGHFYVARIDGSWQRYEVAADNGVSLDDGTSTNGPLSELTKNDEAPRIERAEQEPNDSPGAANQITANSSVRGTISYPANQRQSDADLFRFHAHQGQQLVLEINASRQNSPLDSKLEILDAAGNAVPRVLLQAVRATYFTFRGHDSTSLSDFRLHQWEDMDLNEYVYANGEVVKLWMFPRGPDSGFLVYPGIEGSRYAYFGTTPITHALNEPCYVVEPHPPGTKLVPNGLPQFSLYFENDDDGARQIGADSRVMFTAPADGEYLARVTDVRDESGDDYKYELTVRAPRPDFQIKVDAPDLTINAGGGKEFAIKVERLDDFDEEIHVEVANLPPGFHASTPLTIEAGQTTAYGTITADADARAPTAENCKLATVVASAKINGEKIAKEAVSLGELKLTEKPNVLVQVVTNSEAPRIDARTTVGKDMPPMELVIAPGETISATVKVDRNGFDGEILFGKEYAGRNLPHGVYVDNIGLNGMTLLRGETERTFFITAAKWVPKSTRLFHLRAEVEGKPTSWPVVLQVRNRHPTPP